MPRYNPVLDALPDYPFVELDRRKAALRARGQRVFDFTIGDPVEPAPEFVREALRDAVLPSCPYPSVAGSAEVRRAIAGYLQRRFGVTLDPERAILPAAGAKEVVFHTPLLVIDGSAADRLVIFPDPGYPACARGALFAGAEPHAVPLDGDHVFRPWTLPEDVLRRARLLWINTPHNPSGAVMSLDDLRRTVEVCQAHDILLVSDETYADIYHEVPPPSALQAGARGVLALHSLSKRSGMTGYRSGFIAGDPEVVQRLRKLRANPGLVPQDFVNAAAAAAWAEDGHVHERRALFHRKKQIFLDFFDEVGLEALGREATIYLWVRVPSGMTDEEYASNLMSSGIVVSPGRMFGVTGAGAGHVRLAMVPSEAECHEAVAAWRRTL
jgi:acetylornithine aminotransferase